MAAIHFFTETSKLKTQSSSDAYGPVVGSLNTEYRTTLKGFLNADAKAIAVCQCKVYLQPGASSNLVNAVLVPVLPNIDLNTGYTPVRYFIYRGLKKSDILDGSNEIIAEDPTNIGLVAKLWTNFNTLVADKAGSTEPITATKPNAKALGWQYAGNPTTDLMEKIIYETDDDHEVISVAGGTEIGEFVSGNEGFEIVLAERMYLPDLANIQAAETTITASAPSGGDIPGNEPIANMRKREEILNYIDPVAWFNLFHDVGVYQYGNSNPIKGFDDIYSTFLQGFATSNTLYIDIRNENGYSLNYYKDNEGEISDTDYGKHLQYSIDGLNYIEEIYYDYYWPIKSFNLTSGSSGFIKYYFSFRTHFNPSPLLYIDYGFRADTGEIPVDSYKFVPRDFAISQPSSDWSEGFPIALHFLTNGNNTSLYLKFMLIRNVKSENTLPNTVLDRNTHLDNIFGPVQEIPNITKAGSSQWRVALGKRFLDARTVTPYQFAGVYETGIGVSDNDIIFYANSIAEYRDLEETITVNILSENTGFKNLLPQSGNSIKNNLFELEIFKNIPLTKDTIITGQGNVEVIKQSKFVGINVNYSVLLSMTRIEYDVDIATHFSSFDLNKHDLFFQFSKFKNEITAENKKYYKTTIKLVGYENAGEKHVQNTNLTVFSVDRFVLNTIAIGANTNLIKLAEQIIDINTVISDIEHIEDVYWLPIGRDNQEIEKMLTRLRSHSYGSAREAIKKGNIIELMEVFKNSLKPWALNLAIPKAYYNEPLHKNNIYASECYSSIEIINAQPEFGAYCRIKMLYENEINQQTFNRISNYKSAGSSPLFTDPNNNLIDFGHMVYGFEGLLYADPDYVLIKATNARAARPSKGFQNFGITDSNDLTGFIADIATGIAEAYVKNKSEDYDNTYQELLDIEYSSSANSPDLLSDIDAIGLAYTYRSMSGSNIKFSEVLKEYYGTSIPSHSGHYTNRFKIFCIVQGLIENTGAATNDGFIWKGNQTAVKQPILDRMETFANFWLNTIEENGGLKNIYLSH